METDMDIGATAEQMDVREADAADNAPAAARDAYAGGWSKLKSLDGKLRTYTFSVLTTLALGIATVYFDAEIFSHSDDDEDDVLMQKVTAIETASAAGRQILRALLLLLLCIAIGTCAFFLIGINVYPFSAEQVGRHRRWLVFAFFAVVATNTMVITSMATAQTTYNRRKERKTNYESSFTHYLLFVCLLVSTLIMDVFFLVVFWQNIEEVGAHEAGGWDRVRKQLSTLVRLNRAQGTGQQSAQPSLQARARSYFGQMLDSITRRALRNITAIVRVIRVIIGLSNEEEDDTSMLKATKYLTIDISEFFTLLADKVWESCLFQTTHSLASFVTWNFWRWLRRLVDRPATVEEADQSWIQRLVNTLLQTIDDTVLFWRDLGPRIRSWVDGLYEDVREDDQFKHSSWVLAAMCTSAVLLIYFGVGLSVRISGYLDEMYAPRRDCAVSSIERNGRFGDFVFRMAGFTEGSRDLSSAASPLDDQVLTETVCSLSLNEQQQQLFEQFNSNLTSALEPGETPTLPSDVQSAQQTALEGGQSILGNISAPGNVSVDDSNMHLFRCSSSDSSDNPCLLLALINDLEERTSTSLNETITPTQVFHDHGIGRTIYVIDRLLHHFVWAIWIGLMVGLLVGILSLLSVLAQYKRFSLAIRSGFFQDLSISENLFVADNQSKHIKRVNSVVTERNWAELVEFYPMGASVFFFGILVSTAVIQLVVFGGAVAFLLSLIASIFEARVFAILRPYLALLIAFLITWLINGPIAQRVVSEGILVRKYRIHHELTFLLFLLVYTAVHLVLGVFIALIRLIWVLLTTIACLNRLDRNLFPLLKGNDLGHKSFMSMVLMQHAFLSNADTGEQMPFTKLYDMVRQRNLELRLNDTRASSSSSRPIGAVTSPSRSAVKSAEEHEEGKPSSPTTVRFRVREEAAEVNERPIAAHPLEGFESATSSAPNPNAPGETKIDVPHYLRDQ